MSTRQVPELLLLDPHGRRGAVMQRLQNVLYGQTNLKQGPLFLHESTSFFMNQLEGYISMI